jgi:MSHA biogenesis protein MshK
MVAGVMTIRKAVFLLICSLPVAAWAQVLSDPTRPPLEIGDGSVSTVQHAAPAAARGLLSVIISAERCAAIIDGKTIRLGERYGDAVLVEINAQGVVLQQAQARRTMVLFPGVGVTVTAAQPSSQQAVMCRLENQKYDNQKTVNKATRQTGLKEKK